MSLLKEVGLTKAEIRELSKERNLPIWDKPSFACLASRFPYGTRLSPELFHRVDSAEEILRNLGFKQYRVRYHGDVARIELPKDDFNKLAKFYGLDKNAEEVLAAKNYLGNLILSDMHLKESDFSPMQCKGMKRTLVKRYPGISIRTNIDNI